MLWAPLIGLVFFVCQETYEKRRELQRKELQQKEDEMRQVFVQRVKEKEQVLKEAEREVSSHRLSIAGFFLSVNSGSCTSLTLHSMVTDGYQSS